MEILKKAFGIYATNCYILRTNIGDFIIDPGQNSAKWVLENAQNPLAILNTHGHFDHIWCNFELKNALKIPIFCPKDDAFMLKSDCFNLGLPTQAPDVEVENDAVLIFDKNGLLRGAGLESGGESGESFGKSGGGESGRESRGESTRHSADSKDSQPKDSPQKSSKDSPDSRLTVEFMHFPGHTPGCSVIKIGGVVFSGDFVFKDSIGRSDFPYSDECAMQDSLRRFAQLRFDAPLYPGHGESSSIKDEQKNIPFYLRG